MKRLGLNLFALKFIKIPLLKGYEIERGFFEENRTILPTVIKRNDISGPSRV